LVAVVLFVDLGQAGFGIGCAGTEEGDDPHPDYGAGTAETDGQCHADDVAGAHPAGKCEGEGLEGGDAGPFGAVVLEEEPYHFGEVAYLHKSGAEGEIECRCEAQAYERPAPYIVVEDGYYFVHVFVVLCC